MALHTCNNTPDNQAPTRVPPAGFPRAPVTARLSATPATAARVRFLCTAAHTRPWIRYGFRCAAWAAWWALDLPTTHLHMAVDAHYACLSSFHSHSCAELPWPGIVSNSGVTFDLYLATLAVAKAEEALKAVAASAAV